MRIIRVLDLLALAAVGVHHLAAVDEHRHDEFLPVRAVEIAADLPQMRQDENAEDVQMHVLDGDGGPCAADEMVVGETARRHGDVPQLDVGEEDLRGVFRRFQVLVVLCDEPCGIEGVHGADGALLVFAARVQRAAPIRFVHRDVARDVVVGELEDGLFHPFVFENHIGVGDRGAKRRFACVDRLPIILQDTVDEDVRVLLAELKPFLLDGQIVLLAI